MKYFLCPEKNLFPKFFHREFGISSQNKKSLELSLHFTVQNLFFFFFAVSEENIPLRGTVALQCLRVSPTKGTRARHRKRENIQMPHFFHWSAFLGLLYGFSLGSQIRRTFIIVINPAREVDFLTLSCQTFG